MENITTGKTAVELTLIDDETTHSPIVELREILLAGHDE
jgi:hypothetical protein